MFTITSRVARAARRRGVTVLSHRKWGSRYRHIYADRRRTKPHRLLPGRPSDTLVQHITVTFDTGPLVGDFKTDVRTVERIGYERFRSGLSYNWVWDPITGDVAIGQPLDAKGTHTVNDKGLPGFSYDQNAVALAIAMLGMPGVKPTDKALRKLQLLIAAHVDAGALTPGFDYMPHSAFAFKDCPTDALRDRMPTIRRNALEAAK